MFSIHHHYGNKFLADKWGQFVCLELYTTLLSVKEHDTQCSNLKKKKSLRAYRTPELYLICSTIESTMKGIHIPFQVGQKERLLLSRCCQLILYCSTVLLQLLSHLLQAFVCFKQLLFFTSSFQELIQPVTSEVRHTNILTFLSTLSSLVKRTCLC